jgi:Flp pilus assembly protein TadB
MSGWAALVAAGSAWLSISPSATPARRLSPARTSSAAVAVSGRFQTDDQAPRGWVESPWMRGAVCVVSGAVAGHAVGGLALAGVGAVLGAVGSWLIARLEPPSARRRREAIDRDLPLAVELLAACALAGLAVETSIDVVASAVGGPLREILVGHSLRVRLGADPVRDWRRLQRHPQIEPLARSMVRSAESGTAVAESLDRLSADVRRARAGALQSRARSVGVQAAGPLGLCFLPAFMLIGVAPTVIGGFTHLILGASL